MLALAFQIESQNAFAGANVRLNFTKSKSNLAKNDIMKYNIRFFF